jgi:hypothetical protein
VAFKECPVFEYLDSNYGAILGGVRDKRKAVYRGPQSTFPPFYRKDLIVEWYYNLRNPPKATSLVTQGILRPDLSTKKDEGFFLEINRVKVLPTFQ